jgi:hypothetical protein
MDSEISRHKPIRFQHDGATQSWSTEPYVKEEPAVQQRPPQEPTIEAENPTQMEGVVDVDAIPSPEPVSPTLVRRK